MELPIQLAFFRKLELWQELRRQDRNSRNSNMAWRIEKDILKWARTRHHHLGTPLTGEYLWDENNRILDPSNRDRGSLTRAMENLVQRGFGSQVGDNIKSIDQDGIRIAEEGLLMGDVIASNWFVSKWYPFFYWLTWITVFAGLILFFQKFWIDICVPVFQFVCRHR